MANKRKPIEYYVNENGCHICTSHSKDRKGYTFLVKDGFRYMHRWLFWQATGKKPQVVEHVCNNPSCINIEHLKGGDYKSNGRYMALCGNQHMQKLTPEQALKIFHDQRKYPEIAKDYGISRNTVSDIKNGRSWSYVTGACLNKKEGDE